MTWPTEDPSGSERSEQRDWEAYNRRAITENRRLRWMRERGIAGRPTRGRLEARRAQKRRAYRRLKAEALGVDLTTAERTTPRQPAQARYGKRQRDALGRYVPAAGSPRPATTPATGHSPTAAEA